MAEGLLLFKKRGLIRTEDENGGSLELLSDKSKCHPLISMQIPSSICFGCRNPEPNF